MHPVQCSALWVFCAAKVWYRERHNPSLVHGSHTLSKAYDNNGRCRAAREGGQGWRDRRLSCVPPIFKLGIVRPAMAALIPAPLRAGGDGAAPFGGMLPGGVRR